MKNLTGLCLALLGCAASLAASADAERVRLRTSHVDIAVVYQPADETNRLAIRVSDDDQGRSFASNEVALVATEASQLTLPPGTLFGEADAPFWVLPQSQSPDVLYLGLSGEALPLGVFAGELSLRLVDVRGPGHFFLWQAGAFGDFDVRMNSADGVGADDQVPLAAGGHAHFNWGFTSNGVYDVVLQVTGRRAGVETNDFSLPTALRFEVEPLPPAPASPFAEWQRMQWPGEDRPAVIAPGADPDGDQVPNAVEYALGLDPHTPDRARLPQLRMETVEGQPRMRLRCPHPRAATDARILCRAATRLEAPDWIPLDPAEVVPVNDTLDEVVFDLGAPAGHAARFVQLSVELTL